MPGKDAGATAGSYWLYGQKGIPKKRLQRIAADEDDCVDTGGCGNGANGTAEGSGWSASGWSGVVRHFF